MLPSRNPVPPSARLSWMAPLWGCVLGAAWQVTQARLWGLPAYLWLTGLGLVLLISAVFRRRNVLHAWLLLVFGAACCVGGVTGWRAHVYLAQTLPKNVFTIF